MYVVVTYLRKAVRLVSLLIAAIARLLYKVVSSTATRNGHIGQAYRAWAVCSCHIATSVAFYRCSARSYNVPRKLHTPSHG